MYARYHSKPGTSHKNLAISSAHVPQMSSCIPYPKNNACEKMVQDILLFFALFTCHCCFQVRSQDVPYVTTVSTEVRYPLHWRLRGPRPGLEATARDTISFFVSQIFNFDYPVVLPVA